MPDGEAGRRAHRLLPARAGLGAAARVEPQARDDHVDVAAVGVDGDPLALAGLAPAREGAGGHRAVEQVAAVERVGDRARAVVARSPPTCRGRRRSGTACGDLVARRDDLLDHLRRVGRRDREAVLGQLRPSRPAASWAETARAAVCLASELKPPRALGGLEGELDAADVAARDAAVDARGRARARGGGRFGEVPRPKTPSARLGKPARRSSCWSARTSSPRSPLRSVRSPSWAWRPAAAKAARSGQRGRAERGDQRDGRRRRNGNSTASTTSLSGVPTGLAVGLAQKEQRYVTLW